MIKANLTVAENAGMTRGNRKRRPLFSRRNIDFALPATTNKQAGTITEETIIPPRRLRLAANLAFLLPVFALNGCGTAWKITDPSKTALDQMLLSVAADRAAETLVKNYQQKTGTTTEDGLGKLYINTKNFNSSQNDQQYALHAIRRSLIESGATLVDDLKKADTVAEVSLGASSVDNTSTLFGIPSFSVPIPFSGTIKTPQISLYEKTVNRGLEKFSISFYNRETGKVQNGGSISLGTAQVDSLVVFLFLKITENDLKLPNEYKSAGDSDWW